VTALTLRLLWFLAMNAAETWAIAPPKIYIFCKKKIEIEIKGLTE
jgi:hypothetical protein